MKILLVEDDTALRGALEELLQREGYEVLNASNIRTARDSLGADVDLIMLDVGLPDGDGVTLCKQWRYEGVQIPILFLTAKDEELDVVRGLDAGGPISNGERKAIRAWQNSKDDTLIMKDFLWEADVAGFVYALRSAGITKFIFANQSTALMENLHGLAAAGCKIGRLVSWVQEGRTMFEYPETVMGIEIEL